MKKNYQTTLQENYLLMSFLYSQSNKHGSTEYLKNFQRQSIRFFVFNYQEKSITKIKQIAF